MKKLLKLTFILFLVCAVTAGILGVVNELTKDRIEQINIENTNKAYQSVLASESFTDLGYSSDAHPNVDKISKADNGAGYVVESTFSGAQGMITMVVGLDSDYNCTGVYVTKHSETSGLGAKAADTNEGAWRENLVGQGDGMKLAKDGGDITAISGATITSRAVVTEVQTVINAAKSLG